MAISTIHGAPPRDSKVDVIEPVTERGSSENHVRNVSKVGKLLSAVVHVLVSSS